MNKNEHYRTSMNTARNGVNEERDRCSEVVNFNRCMHVR